MVKRRGGEFGKGMRFSSDDRSVVSTLLDRELQCARPDYRLPRPVDDHRVDVSSTFSPHLPSIFPPSDFFK